jgi:hypothetical protein
VDTSWLVVEGFVKYRFLVSGGSEFCQLVIFGKIREFLKKITIKVYFSNAGSGPWYFKDV